MIGHFVSATVRGERCTVCRAMGDAAGGGDVKATHKVGEEIANDEPMAPAFPGVRLIDRHNFTTYVCCRHFRELFGDAVFCP